MASVATLVVGGLTPFTTIDFPDRLAAVVFCQGCPWQCGYCHNRHLQPRRADDQRNWTEVKDWLKSRCGLLDAVVFSGGEPLLQRGLGDAMAEVRDLGFAIGLHSAGMYPDRLKAVLPQVDWIGFDIKGPFEDYRRITGADAGDAVRTSLAAVLAAGIDHEIRCTVDPTLLDADAIGRMAGQLADCGVSRLVLQACRSGNVTTPVPEALMSQVAAYLPQVLSRDA